MSNLLEILSKLVGIVTGLITIAKACRNYIADRKSSKKDPSASFPAPDGSEDDDYIM